MDLSVSMLTCAESWMEHHLRSWELWTGNGYCQVQVQVPIPVSNPNPATKSLKEGRGIWDGSITKITLTLKVPEDMSQLNLCKLGLDSIDCMPSHYTGEWDVTWLWSTDGNVRWRDNWITHCAQYLATLTIHHHVMWCTLHAVIQQRVFNFISRWG